MGWRQGCEGEGETTVMFATRFLNWFLALSNGLARAPAWSLGGAVSVYYEHYGLRVTAARWLCSIQNVNTIPHALWTLVDAMVPPGQGHATEPL